MRSTKLAGPAFLVFVLVVVLANVPAFFAVLRNTLGQGATGIVTYALSLVMLASLLIGTWAAVVHYRANADLRGFKRRAWYVLLCMPALGAIAYYLAVMRRAREEPAVGSTP